MPLTVPQARGVLLEEMVAKLLVTVGYRRLGDGDEGVESRHNGLCLRGRGEWHQIDCIGVLQPTPPFIYPIRLLVEAKCYAPGRPVNLTVPRNALGVLRDIDENFFTIRPEGKQLQAPRFNHRMAVFSTSGYSRNAQRYALAHQIFLITYEHVPLMADVADGLLDLENCHFKDKQIPSPSLLQEGLRELLNERHERPQDRSAACGAFSEEGIEHLEQRVLPAFRKIKGSYFGMLQGRYPMHLVAEQPIPPEVVAEQDELRCRIRRNDSGDWQFEYGEPEAGFRLEFDLPDEIARLASGLDDPRELAELKKREFSFIELTGTIGGVRRLITLTLDYDWLRRIID